MEGWPRLRNNPPALESLAKKTVPVLIIFWDNDLTYITVSSKYLAGEISSAKLVVIKNVAHMLNLENPAALNKLMIDFLKSK